MNVMNGFCGSPPFSRNCFPNSVKNFEVSSDFQVDEFQRANPNEFRMNSNFEATSIVTRKKYSVTTSNCADEFLS